MQVKTVPTNQSSTLSYRIVGQGMPIVLLHGFPVSGALWSRVWGGLAENYTVIVPDFPGVGGSDVMPDLSMKKMADAVKQVLDNEGITAAVVAGHSMGGYVAMELVNTYPNVIKGLAMVHSVASADTDEKKEQRRKAIALIEKGGKDAFVKQMIPTLFSEETIVKQPDLIETQLKEALKTPAESLVAFYNAMINRENRVKLLQEAAFPVLWIAGASDNLIPKEKIMQQTILSSVNFVEVYGNCGHMAMLEEPDRLIMDMTDFLKYCFAE